MKKIFCLLLAGICCWGVPASAQNANSVLDVDGGLTPPSPNAQMAESMGNIPVSLYEGIPSISFPVYTVKCGSLSLPISLSYYYNGFRPLQDAGWVGLGWSLNAGGVITRYLQGAPDGSEPSGYNYGEYSLSGKLFSGNPNSFLQNAYCTYNNNVSGGGNFYDMAPDIFQANFNGYAIKFYWLFGKAYTFPYYKGLSVNWPSPTSNITITTPDGVIYLFGATESTTVKSFYTGVGGTVSDFLPAFISAWNLTSVISPDKKDTISLSYGTSNWNQFQTPCTYEWVQTKASNQTATYANSTYAGHTSISAQVLQSITCRNTQVNFIPDPSGRTDIGGSYPALHEIDVIDKTSGTIVKKNTFTYEYYGQGATPTTSYYRLKLKKFSIVDPQSVAAPQTYTFSYINEYSSWPIKSTLGIDYWGYANGADGNPTLLSNLPGLTNPGIRTPGYPVFYGALDTVSYPSGGYTTFRYSHNLYNDLSTMGPGIRIDSIKNFLPGGTGPATQTYYSYGLGSLSSDPDFSGPTYAAGSSSYYTFSADDWSSGRTTMNSIFYYPNVSEWKSSGTDIHRTDYAFASFSNAFSDVELAGKTDYLYDAASGSYSPLSVFHKSYSLVTDTTLLVASAYLELSTTDPVTGLPVNTYGYNYSYPTTYWRYPTSESITQYDMQGHSITSSTSYSFNAARNLASTTQTLPDNRTILKKFKYPEDYTASITGNMITANVLSPAIERQTWLQYGASNPGLIDGEITAYDQTVFKPAGVYAIETTAPIGALNNETVSGSRYSSLLSDSRYSLREQFFYDANANSMQYNKASDITTSHIWDYSHSMPVAEVKNAAASQIAYTSFEADGSGNWVVSSPLRDNTASITGNSSYNLSNGSISIGGLSSTSAYVVSYWSKTGGAYSVSGSTSLKQGKTIGAWTYFEHTVTGASSVSVTGGGNIDELRLYPQNAQMKTYTYYPLVGVTSACDVGNRITYYQYDGLGRLRVVKDQDGNIIRTNEYHLAGQ